MQHENATHARTCEQSREAFVFQDGPHHVQTPTHASSEYCVVSRTCDVLRQHGQTTHRVRSTSALGGARNKEWPEKPSYTRGKQNAVHRGSRATDTSSMEMLLTTQKCNGTWRSAYKGKRKVGTLLMSTGQPVVGNTAKHKSSGVHRRACSIKVVPAIAVQAPKARDARLLLPPAA